MDTEINEMIRKIVACNLLGKKNVDFTWSGRKCRLYEVGKKM